MKRIELRQLKYVRKPDRNYDKIVEILKDFDDIKIYQTGKTAFAQRKNAFIRLTWNDARVSGWRDPYDVLYDLKEAEGGDKR